jgi:hypothetical protein
VDLDLGFQLDDAGGEFVASEQRRARPHIG